MAALIDAISVKRKDVFEFETFRMPVSMWKYTRPLPVAVKPWCASRCVIC